MTKTELLIEIASLKLKLETMTQDRDAEKAMKAKARDQRDEIARRYRNGTLTITDIRQLGGGNASDKELIPTYTFGHCENKKAPNGCQVHNLHCGYPNCDRKKV